MHINKSLAAIAGIAVIVGGSAFVAAPTQADAVVTAPSIRLLPAPEGLASASYVPENWTGYSKPELTGTTDAGATTTLAVDGASVPLSVSGSAWTATLTTALADGEHTATVTAAPDDGTASSQASLTFQVDTTQPNPPTLIAPLDNTFFNYFPTFSEITDSDAELPSPGMQVRYFYARVTDGKGTPITPSEGYGPLVQSDASNVATWSSPSRSTNNGLWSWYSQVYDEVGNYNDGDWHQFVIDTIAPPTPTIDAPTDPTNVTTLSGTVPVDPHYVDPYPGNPVDAPDSVFEVNVDGRAYNGAVLDTTAGRWSLTLDAPLAPAPGSHTISARWGDEAGNWSPPATIAVYNPVPLEVGDDTAATTASKAVTIDTLRNDTGPDGLAIAGIAGTNGTWSVVDNKLVYVPATGFTGTASGTYTVTDAMDGQTATGTVTVAVTYLPFILKADAVSTDNGKAVTVDVLANDTKPSGTVLVSAAGPSTHGTWMVSNGKAVFTPKVGFVGSATGSYVAKAPDGRTLTGVVTATVGNQIHQPNGDIDTVSWTDTRPVVFVGQKSSPRAQGWGTVIGRGNTIDRNATGKTGRVTLSFQVIDRASRKPVPAGMKVALRSPDGTPFALHKAVRYTTTGGWATFTINPANTTKPGTYRFKTYMYAGKGFAAHNTATTWLIKVVR